MMRSQALNHRLGRRRYRPAQLLRIVAMNQKHSMGRTQGARICQSSEIRVTIRVDMHCSQGCRPLLDVDSAIQLHEPEALRRHTIYSSSLSGTSMNACSACPRPTSLPSAVRPTPDAHTPTRPRCLPIPDLHYRDVVILKAWTSPSIASGVNVVLPHFDTHHPKPPLHENASFQ